MVRNKIGWAVFAPLVLIIAACTTAAPPDQEAATDSTLASEPTAAPIVEQPTPNEAVVEEIVLPDLGQAPEITNELWINADVPVTLASQQGKVVLVEFWTFG